MGETRVKQNDQKKFSKAVGKYVFCKLTEGTDSDELCSPD